MKLTNQLLKETSFGDPIVFETDTDTLEVFKSDNRWSEFSIIFNGKHESFKSLGGLNGRVNKLIDKFDLHEAP